MPLRVAPIIRHRIYETEYLVRLDYPLIPPIVSPATMYRRKA